MYLIPDFYDCSPPDPHELCGCLMCHEAQAHDDDFPAWVDECSACRQAQRQEADLQNSFRKDAI